MFRSETQIYQFRYIKIHPKPIDLRTRLWGTNTLFVVLIPPRAEVCQAELYYIKIVLFDP